MFPGMHASCRCVLATVNDVLDSVPIFFAIASSVLMFRYFATYLSLYLCFVAIFEILINQGKVVDLLFFFFLIGKLILFLLTGEMDRA